MRWRALGAAVLLVLTAAGSPLAETREAAAAPADYAMTGIDVSHYQGTIDWSTVAASGEDFAYAKVSEGVTYADPSFTANRSGALAARVSFGAYHFGRPDKGDARGQADRLVDLGGYAGTTGRTQPDPGFRGGMLPPMLDIEWPWFTNPDGTPYDTCYGLTPAAMVAWIADFVDQVRVRTGMATMIYTNPNWWNLCTASNADFSAHPLFVSKYSSTEPTVLPPGWTKWTLWQYTSTGTVPGVGVAVDRNVFVGTAAEMAYLVGTRVPPAPVRTLAPVVQPS